MTGVEGDTPLGVRYCLSHSGLREEDQSNGCDMREDDAADDCEFVELYPGAVVVDTYHDDIDDDEDADS